MFEIISYSDQYNDLKKVFNYVILHTDSNYEETPFDDRGMIEWAEYRIANGFPIFLAYLEGHIAGIATYGTFRYKSGFRYTAEHSVYILPEFQGKGLGKELLQLLIDTASNNGLHILVACINEQNKISIALHEKLGFQSVGTMPEVAFKMGGWKTLHIMQRMLK